MAGLIQFLPMILNAAGTLRGGQDAKLQARLLEEEARVAGAQAAREEEAQRRQARIALGRQAAAVAESGGGSGGSAGLLLAQSAALAELDALNIRYAGAMRARGLRGEALALRAQAKQAPLFAGAQLLQGFSRMQTTSRILGG